MEAIPDDTLSRICSFLSPEVFLQIALTSWSLRRRVLLLFSKFASKIFLDSSCKDDLIIQKRVLVLPHLTTLVASVGQCTQRWTYENHVISMKNDWMCNLESITISGLVDSNFFRFFSHCPHLVYLNMVEARLTVKNADNVYIKPTTTSGTNPTIGTMTTTEMISPIESPLYWPKKISFLGLPKLNPITQASTLTSIVNYSNLNTFLFCYFPSENFWVDFSKTADEKKTNQITHLDLYIQGDGTWTDNHLTQVMKIFPSLYHIDVTGTMFKFLCLQEEFYNKNVKSVHLPWPQANDYSATMKSFIERTPDLDQITIMARDDDMIKVLCKSCGPSIKLIAILLAEGVTSDGFALLLQSCTKVDTLYLRVDDNTIFTEQVFDALSKLPNLEKVQISNRETIFGKTVIRHPTVKTVSLLELEVEEIEIECPKANVNPPKVITSEDCAKKVYTQLFPERLIIRITDGIDTEVFEINQNELVQNLLSRAMGKFGKEFPFLIYKRKKLPLDVTCGKVLESGCLLTAMG